MDPASEKLFDLIELIYESAAEPAKWRLFLENISRHFNDAWTALSHVDHDDVKLNFVETAGYDPSTLRALQDRYIGINPWMPKKLIMLGGSLLRTEELYPEHDLIKTEFYGDFLRPNDLFNGFGINVFNDRRFGFLSIIRSRRAGPPTEEELRQLKVLTPHRQRAVQLHERFSLLPVNNAPVAVVLDQTPVGVNILGQDGRALHVNRAAGQICAQIDGFSIDRDEFCRASHTAEQTRLQFLINGAANCGGRADLGSGGVMSVERQSLRRPYCIVVSPMPSVEFDFGSKRAAAMVLISDPDARVLAPPDVLKQVYRLTPAEARLAAKLGNAISVAAST